MEHYLQGVARQAENRETRALHNVDTYMGTRRMDSGVGPCFSPCEFHLSIPDEAFYHPVVKELRDASIELIVLDNVSGRFAIRRYRCLFTSLLVTGHRLLQQRASDRQRELEHPIDRDTPIQAGPVPRYGVGRTAP